MRPPRLPASEADLAEWSVYADWLLERGDPRGELLAQELAICARPSREEVAAFRARVDRRYGSRGKATTETAWCLDHVAMLVLREVGRVMMRGPVGPQDGTLANVARLLRTPAFALLETFAFAFEGQLEPKGGSWRRLLAALPATCTRLEVGLIGAGEDGEALRRLVDWVPPTVRELVLGRERRRWRQGASRGIAGVTLDRFAVVEVAEVEEWMRAEVEAALAATRTVVLRVRRAASWLRQLERCVVGRACDALVVDGEAGRVEVLERWSPIALARRYGPIPARARVAAELAEDHDVEGEALLVRRGAEWTVRAAPEEGIRGIRDGEAVGRWVFRERAGLAIRDLLVG